MTGRRSSGWPDRPHRRKIGNTVRRDPPRLAEQLSPPYESHRRGKRECLRAFGFFGQGRSVLSGGSSDRMTARSSSLRLLTACITSAPYVASMSTGAAGALSSPPLSIAVKPGLVAVEAGSTAHKPRRESGQLRTHQAIMQSHMPDKASYRDVGGVEYVAVNVHIYISGVDLTSHDSPNGIMHATFAVKGRAGSSECRPEMGHGEVMSAIFI